jgi:multidrug efflux pump subunit AcrB
VEALIRGYSHLLRWVLHRRGVVILLTLLIFGGGSVWMIPQIPQEVLPSINTGQANLRVQFPPSTTLDQNRQVMGAIDEILLAQPETLYAFTTAGGALFGTNTNANTLRGSSTITLKSGTDVQAFSDRLTETFDQLNLIDTTIRINTEVVRGLILTNSPVRSDLDLGLQGDDPDLLQQAGQKVLKALRKEAKLATAMFFRLLIPRH